MTSLDFRKKELSIRSKEGLSFAQVAKRFGASVNGVFLWSKKLKPKRGKNRPAIKVDGGYQKISRCLQLRTSTTFKRKHFRYLLCLKTARN